ncbi:putative fatty acyl-CoA reductase CG5065 [Anabrus simplex]|uniref:putative fatty acyl-CoA reductase CG5065 n=1 Tax=Anabrus simplex TaxID=316456 RepID=UPI0035A3B3FD
METGTQQLSEEELLKMPNRITDTLNDRVVLITGATGFMGKVLVEKILRKCPGVDTVYVLVRPKKGREPRQRVEDIFTSPLYDKLKAQRGLAILKKVVGIAGDVSAPDLGLSEADRKLLCERVDIVVHAAATIRFDEPLKKIILLNTRGTHLMLELAAQMKKLEGFFYISTAYCHLSEKVLYEKVYPPPADPHTIIKLVETTSEEVLEAMTKTLLGNLPNTYSLSKALAEGLVAEQMDKLPVMILRPSVVIPVWEEPLPGWTDNINGPTGLLIGAGKGVIRTMYCKSEGYADFIPVDAACSGVLLAIWNFIGNKDWEHRVVHLTTSSEVRVSWSQIIDLGRRLTQKVPFNNILWYPGGSMKNSRWVHNICVLLFHILPAIFIDTLIFLSGHKPVLLRIHRRIIKGFEMFEYYANNQWEFQNDLVVIIRGRMNARELQEINIDSSKVDLEAYFEDCIRAARLYILKETPEQLPAARRHMRIMYWVDKITKFLLLVLLMYTIFSWSDTIVELFLGIFRLIGSAVNALTGPAPVYPVPSDSAP